MKHTLLAIIAGIVSGMLALASLSGASVAVFFLSLVHPLPLFHAGLSMGTRAALIASATAVLVMSVFSPLLGVVYAVLYAVPAWLLVRLSVTGPNGVVWDVPEDQAPRKPEGPETRSTFADRLAGRTENWDEEAGAPPRDLGWYPASRILAVLTAMAGLFIVIASVLTGGGLEEQIKALLSQVADAFAAPQGEDVLQQAVASIAPYFAGMAAAMWAVWMLVNMVIAQGLLAKGGRNIRPSPRLRELTLPDALSWALVISACIALIAPGELEYIGRNMAIVLAVPFFFLGLGVVHKLAGQFPFPGALLALVYILVIFTGWLAMVIAGLGILEQWVGLRKRMDQPTK